MKKLVILTLLFSVAFITSCKKDPKKAFVGTWKVESIDGETKPEGEPDITMTFNADGTAVQKADGEVDDEGKWELSEDGKMITLTSGEDSEKKEEMSDIELKDGKLSFKAGEKKIVLVKE